MMSNTIIGRLIAPGDSRPDDLVRDGAGRPCLSSTLNPMTALARRSRPRSSPIPRQTTRAGTHRRSTTSPSREVGGWSQGRRFMVKSRAIRPRTSPSICRS